MNLLLEQFSLAMNLKEFQQLFSLCWLQHGCNGQQQRGGQADGRQQFLGRVTLQG